MNGEIVRQAASLRTNASAGSGAAPSLFLACLSILPKAIFARHAFAIDTKLSILAVTG